MAGKALQKHSQASQLKKLTSDSVKKTVLLGSGRFAAVWLGRFKGKSCVVKVPTRKDAAKQLDMDLEIFTLEGLSHPNVVHVMGIWEDPSEPGSLPCVVMENCEMSLPEYLRENKSTLKRSHGAPSATEIKIRILLDVVRGLIYLHQRDILHGDLRSSNLLIQKESEFPLIKISDYGYVQRVDPLTKARRAEILCDGECLPPEMVDDRSSVRKNTILTPQVDVFMFGDVALETATLEPVLCTRKVTESKLNGTVTVTEVERRTEMIRKIVQLGDKDVFTGLINSCLAEKPEQRLSTSDIEGMLQTHLHYYQGHPYANERQDKAAECERLRAEKRTEWKRVQELQRQLKAFEDSKKQMKKQSGAIEGVKEGQTSAECEGIIAAQLTNGSLKVADEVSALSVEKDALLKQVHELEHKMEESVKESKEQLEHRDIKIAELQSKVARRQSQVDSMQRQVNSLKAENDKLLNAQSSWLKERLALKNEIQDMQDEHRRLKESSVQGEAAWLKKMANFREMLCRDMREVDALKAFVAETKVSVTTQIVELKADVEVAKRGTLRTLIKNTKASDKAKQVLEHQLKTTFESDAADLNELVRLLSQKNAILEGDLHLAQDKHEKAQQGYSSSQMKVDQQGKTINEQVTKIAELESQLYAAKAVEDGLKSEIARRAKSKDDRDRSEKEHEKAFQSVIDALTECHRKVFGVKDKDTSHPIGGTQDVILALKGRLDPKWRQFGVFLGVDHYTMDIIEANRSNVTDRMLQLVSQWMNYLSSTGGHPRTWETVVKAVKDTGNGILVDDLAVKYGITIL